MFSDTCISVLMMALLWPKHHHGFSVASLIGTENAALKKEVTNAHQTLSRLAPV
jgi:hypothetical protein